VERNKQSIRQFLGDENIVNKVKLFIYKQDFKSLAIAATIAHYSRLRQMKLSVSMYKAAIA